MFTEGMNCFNKYYNFKCFDLEKPQYLAKTVIKKWYKNNIIGC